MKQLMKIAFIIPGDIETPTGGYRYAKNILRQWDNTGQASKTFVLGGNYPFPDAASRESAMKLLEEILNWADVIVIDGLAGGALPEFVGAMADKKPVVALVHHPLCLENGLSEAQAQSLRISEYNALNQVNAVIAPRPVTATAVTTRCVAQAKMTALMAVLTTTC